MLTALQFAEKALAGPTPFKVLGRDYDGADCWGLVVLAYRDVLEIELPGYDGRYASVGPTRALAELLERERDAASWREVLKPAALDVVLLRVGDARVPTHCGLIIDARRGEMLHVLEGTEVCVELLGGLLWRDRQAGFWRHPTRVPGEADGV